MEETIKIASNDYTPDQKAEAWSKTAEIIKVYSDDMVAKWNSEIDTLLVYVRCIPGYVRLYTKITDFLD